jgi:MFS family permease
MAITEYIATAEEVPVVRTTTMFQTNTQRVQNPFMGMDDKDIIEDAHSLAESNGLGSKKEAFKVGALVARSTLANATGFETLSSLDENTKLDLQNEHKSPYRSLPWTQFFLAALCAGCAIVQGMDQTIINGAQEYYFHEFNVTEPPFRGFVNGAPYVIAALSGAPLNLFLNKRFGRRGTLAFGCIIAFFTAILQAVSVNLAMFIASRMLLGFAVGVMSSTTPVYAAETAPAAVRGAMTMMWQMWTAAGIMIGLGVSAGLVNVHTPTTGFLAGKFSQWRIMMGLTAVPPLIVGALIYTLPESPRYYLEKGQIEKAYHAMRRLRKSDVFAARDLYLSYKKLEVEKEINQDASLWTRLRQSLKTRRTLRAFQSSWFVMIMQQMCGGMFNSPLSPGLYLY